MANGAQARRHPSRRRISTHRKCKPAGSDTVRPVGVHGMAMTTETFSGPVVQPGLRLFTAADLAAMPEHLPSGDVSYELHHGRLVLMSPPGAIHGNLQIRIGAELISQGEKKGYGNGTSSEFAAEDFSQERRLNLRRLDPRFSAEHC